MPDRPTFLTRIPDVIERLSGKETPAFFTVTGVSELLGCTTRNARRWIADSPAATRERSGWIIETSDLAELLGNIYMSYGGTKKIRPLLDALQGREPLKIPRAAATSSGPRNVEIVPGEIRIRARTTKELMAAAAKLLRQAKTRSGQEAIEAALQGRDQP